LAFKCHFVGAQEQRSIPSPQEGAERWEMPPLIPAGWEALGQVEMVNARGPAYSPNISGLQLKTKQMLQ